MIVSLLIAIPATAPGVGIVLIEGDHAAYPEADPDGQHLALTIEAAATYYGKIFRDPWSIGLEFRYAAPGSLARAALSIPAGFVEFDPIDQPGRKRLEYATILFSSDVNWSFDATPRDHSEFQLEQKLWRDLSSQEKASWFVGSGPAALEIGYGGFSQDIRGIDALTIALHEVGHLLGVSNVRPELDDIDFDFPSDLIDGFELAAKASSGRDHLRADSTLMGTTLSPGERRLPSMVDLFAMAAASGWREIDLPRKELWGGGEWHQPSNWAGNRLPDDGDDVFVRAGNVVSLAGEAEAGRLFVDEGATLSLSGHRLAVGELHLRQDARLLQEAQGPVRGDRLFVDASATLSTAIGAGGGLVQNIFLESAHLAGTLELRPTADSLSAGLHQPFLLTPDLEGAFDRVILAGESAWEGMDVLLAGETIGGVFTQLSAHVVIAGDTNADGLVDQADLDAVLAGWGSQVPAAWLESGDLDGSGLVDQGDLDRVLANWGRSADHLARHVTAIPEPATTALALMCFAAAILVSRRLGFA